MHSILHFPHHRLHLVIAAFTQFDATYPVRRDKAFMDSIRAGTRIEYTP